MTDAFSRTELLLGPEAMGILRQSAVAVFGIGGVGSYAAEALARCGIGRIALFDADVVSPTNLNRQLVATEKTMGRKKVEVMRERILEINPLCAVEARDCFYAAHNADEIGLSGYDYMIDAIDTVSSKLILIARAKAAGVSMISSMGAGNKLDPTRFEVAELFETTVCPLARVMRRELRKLGVTSLKVVYSKEPPVRTGEPEEDDPARAERAERGGAHKRVPGSVSFVPPVAGMILAAEAVKDLIRQAGL